MAHVHNAESLMQLVIKSKPTSNLHTKNANIKPTATDSSLRFITKTAHLQLPCSQTSIYAIKTETTSETVVRSTKALQLGEKEKNRFLSILHMEQR